MSADIRPAATIVLVREGQGEEGPPEIFFVKRHHRSGFMANAYVFPGGRLDAGDCDETLQSRVDGNREHLSARMVGTAEEGTAVAHALAAIRETYEEAGILLAQRDSSPVSLTVDSVRDRFCAHRKALNAGEMSFRDLLEKEDLRVSLNDVHYFANWITPVIEKRRYNARFFVAAAPDGQAGSHDEIETTDSCWLSAEDALAAYDQGGFALAPPTWRILRDLRAFGHVSDVIDWARGLAAVRPIMPHFLQSDGMTVLTLPGDHEHPESGGNSKFNRVVLRDGRWWDA